MMPDYHEFDSREKLHEAALEAATSVDGHIVSYGDIVYVTVDDVVQWRGVYG